MIRIHFPLIKSITLSSLSMVCTHRILYTNSRISHFEIINLLAFTVLQLLKSSQMQHGLRFGDYVRYRYDLATYITRLICILVACVCVCLFVCGVFHIFDMLDFLDLDLSF